MSTMNHAGLLCCTLLGVGCGASETAEDHQLSLSDAGSEQADTGAVELTRHDGIALQWQVGNPGDPSVAGAVSAIPDMTVCISGYGLQCVLTDAAGFFTLSDLPRHTELTIVFKKEGYMPARAASASCQARRSRSFLTPAAARSIATLMAGSIAV